MENNVFSPLVGGVRSKKPKTRLAGKLAQGVGEALMGSICWFLCFK